MEENIEVKDVQKTEYLDKNGLDMLWAKVKENTHNQVEVERNRATTQENIIIETKADKSELHSSYVSNSTFTALEEKVSANTAAISGKQDTGNYLHYETLNNDGYYEIPSVCVINKGNRTDTSITSDEIKVSDESFGYTIITMDGVSNKYYTDVDFALGFNLNRNGIKLQGGDNNHVLTSNGSTIDITEYAKKSEVGGNFIPYYNKYTSSDIQYHKLADRDGIELESYTVCTKLSGGDIKIHSGSESSTINRSGILISSYGGGNGNHFSVNTNSQPELNLYDNGSSIKAKIYTNEHTPVISINEHTSSGRGDDLQLSADGIKMLFKTTKDIVTANNSTAHIGLDDDQTEYTYVAPLENGKVPAKYLDLSQYAKKADISSIATDSAIDTLSYGIEWDTTVSDPTCIRIGNPLFHKSLPIQSQYKGCVVKNGKVNYYLDPNDWSKKADGTPSVLDGTDGDVMVNTPKFYGKSGSNGNKRWVRISQTQIDQSWVEIPELYISAYKITTYTDSHKTKVASVVNTSAAYRGGANNADYDQYLASDKFRTDLGKPRANVSRATMRSNANNSGQELLCYEFYKWVFYWAYVIEYANFNSQEEFNSQLTSDGYHQGGLGPGITTWNGNWSIYNNNSPITPCGYTNEFGNFSGTKEISIPQTQVNDSTTLAAKVLYSNRWRGFENPFGDIWTNLDGIVLKRESSDTDSAVFTTSNAAEFSDNLIDIKNLVAYEIAKDGYTKEFDLRETGEIVPKLVGGSESTYKCDYHLCYKNLVDYRTLLVGGKVFDGGQAGLGAFSSYNGVRYAHPSVGFRSVVRA